MNNRDSPREKWVTDPETNAPLPPRKQPGYYPGYETLTQQNFWDEATRNVVLERVNNLPPIRFFTGKEAKLLQAIVDRIIPQDDRAADRKIPIINFIDRRLFENSLEGYRYEDMPTDQEAHKLGLQVIDETAKAIHGKGFVQLDPLRQDFILKSLHDADELIPHEIWKRMSIERYWMLLVQDCVNVYYAHPWAWDEIGYGGPAYPRAYMRLEGGQPEPWEKPEHRYEWKAPVNSISDRYEPVAGTHQHSSHPGQGGTH
jgi:hypothetical protein